MNTTETTGAVDQVETPHELTALDRCDACGAQAYIRVVVSSGEPGGPSKLKPDPEGYLSAGSRLGIDPGRCLVIGDRDDADGAAARAAGMGFCLIR